MSTYVYDIVFVVSYDNVHTQLWTVELLRLLSIDLVGYQQPQHSQGQWPTPVSLDTESLQESPQQWLPVRLTRPGDLYQLVNVHEFLTDLCNWHYCSPTQLWIVALLPLFPMHLQKHPLLIQPTKGQWPTPVTLGMKSSMESPQQRLPVRITETGDLYQLVQVWFRDFFNFRIVHHNYVHAVVDCGDPPTIPNGSPGTPTSSAFGGTVSYTCNDRSRMSGSATVSCEASGSWSTKPTCSGLWNIIIIVTCMIVNSHLQRPSNWKRWHRLWS